MFEGVRARLERLLREHGRPEARVEASALRAAVIEGKAALHALQDALAATERELALERRHLEDAERRGRLAAALPDSETVAVAARFAERHRERITLLERRLAVQRDELALAGRELDELAARLRSAGTTAGAAASVEAAWRELEELGMRRPTEADDALAAEADRRRQEQAIEAQLAYLKKKLGKE